MEEIVNDDCKVKYLKFVQTTIFFRVILLILKRRQLKVCFSLMGILTKVQKKHYCYIVIKRGHLRGFLGVSSISYAQYNTICILLIRY